MRDKILIIGGYGTIGEYICKELVPIFPNKVIISGRNMNKAVKLNRNMNNKAIPMELNVYAKEFYKEKLKDVYIVICCISPASKSFFNFCLKENIHYIDISPSLEIINEMKVIYKKYPATETTAVFGVGLAPGLSNIMIKEIREEFDSVKEVEISLVLGLGESHGKDGIKWLLENLDTEIDYCGQKHKTFSRRKIKEFPAPLGTKTTYIFNNADQFIAREFLGIESVISRFGYDVSLITDYVALLKKIGFFKLMKFKWIKNVVITLFSNIISIIKKLKIGSDVYSIVIDVEGCKNNELLSKRSSVIGYNNSKLTAKSVIDVFNSIKKGNVKPELYFNNIVDS